MYAKLTKRSFLQSLAAFLPALAFWRVKPAEAVKPIPQPKPLPQSPVLVVHDSPYVLDVEAEMREAMRQEAARRLPREALRAEASERENEQLASPVGPGNALERDV